jgi:hypothetical protein
MLRIWVKSEELLLEGTSDKQILEKLRKGAFNRKKNLRAYAEALVKRTQLVTGEKFNMPVFSYETLFNELIRLGVFEVRA